MKHEMRNIPGVVRAIDRGNGICELVKAPDVLCVMPVRSKKKLRRLLSIAGTVGIFAAAALAVIFLAPALGTILFGIVSGLLFASIVCGEE